MRSLINLTADLDTESKSWEIPLDSDSNTKPDIRFGLVWLFYNLLHNILQTRTEALDVRQPVH